MATMTRRFAGTCWGVCALFMLTHPGSALASDAIYVGKNLTKDGGVLLAGFGDEPSSHWLSIVPRRQHPAGATISVGGTPAANLPGELIDIPQARETFRYISMDYSFFLGLPAPLTNGGMNEFGLAVRDVALFSRRELVDMTPKPQHGVNYSDIARIVLERAHSAREAVDIAVSLIERYGYFTYGGNSHVFADSNEGWVLLEFAGGKGLWVAHRLGPNDIWLNWRGYHKIGYVQTLPAELGKSPDYLASKNFISFAGGAGLVQTGRRQAVQRDRRVCQAGPILGFYRGRGDAGGSDRTVGRSESGHTAAHAAAARRGQGLVGIRPGGRSPRQRQSGSAYALGGAGSAHYRRVRSVGAWASRAFHRSTAGTGTSPIRRPTSRI